MDIKSKKKEMLAKLKPEWDEDDRKNKEYRKAIYEEQKNQLKCFWTYPWGHVTSKVQKDDFGFRYMDCIVCHKRLRW